MNIVTNKRVAIGHSVDHWMHNGRSLQIELDMLQVWYSNETQQSEELRKRICDLMEFKYLANLEMQRQRDTITPHLQPWVVETAEYQGLGHWADCPQLEFDDEKSAREYETLVSVSSQTGGLTRVLRVYQRVLT